MASQRRSYRIAEQIRSIVAMELQRLSDPRLLLVTITGVQMSPDMRMAKVYWAASGSDESREEIDQALHGARGAFRTEIGIQIGMRFAPELRFYYDETSDVQEQTKHLLDRMRAKDAQSSSQSVAISLAEEE